MWKKCRQITNWFPPILYVLTIASGPSKAQGIPSCRASQLSAVEDRNESEGIDGGAGNQALTIAIRNQSTSRCILRGVPGLVLTDNADRQLTTSVCAGCSDYLFPKLPMKTVLLAPNKSAYLLMGYRAECRSQKPLRFRIAGRDARLSLSIIGMLGPNSGNDLQGCSRFNLSPFLEKPPVNGEPIN
jgi:hypothetical protein